MSGPSVNWAVREKRTQRMSTIFGSHEGKIEQIIRDQAPHYSSAGKIGR